jgi:hypothetical protein
MDRRVVFVIGPDGRISYRAMPFREMTDEAYTELGRAVVSTRGQRAR